MISKQESDQATKRGVELLASPNCAVAAVYRPHRKRIIVTLRSGLELAINPDRHQALHQAKPAQLRDIEITPLGDAIFFPKLEDGLYIPGVLQGLTGTQKWMAEQARGKAEKNVSRKAA